MDKYWIYYVNRVTEITRVIRLKYSGSKIGQVHIPGYHSLVQVEKAKSAGLSIDSTCRICIFNLSVHIMGLKLFQHTVTSRPCRARG